MLLKVFCDTLEAWDANCSYWVLALDVRTNCLHRTVRQRTSRLERLAHIASCNVFFEPRRSLSDLESISLVKANCSLLVGQLIVAAINAHCLSSIRRTNASEAIQSAFGMLVQMLRNASKCLKIRRNASECLRMPRNASKCLERPIEKVSPLRRNWLDFEKFDN